MEEVRASSHGSHTLSPSRPWHACKSHTIQHADTSRHGEELGCELHAHCSGSTIVERRGGYQPSRCALNSSALASTPCPSCLPRRPCGLPRVPCRKGSSNRPGRRGCAPRTLFAALLPRALPTPRALLSPLAELPLAARGPSAVVGGGRGLERSRGGGRGRGGGALMSGVGGLGGGRDLAEGGRLRRCLADGSAGALPALSTLPPLRLTPLIEPTVSSVMERGRWWSVRAARTPER